MRTAILAQPRLEGINDARFDERLTGENNTSKLKLLPQPSDEQGTLWLDDPCKVCSLWSKLALMSLRCPLLSVGSWVKPLNNHFFATTDQIFFKAHARAELVLMACRQDVLHEVQQLTMAAL